MEQEKVMTITVKNDGELKVQASQFTSRELINIANKIIDMYQKKNAERNSNPSK